MERIEREVVGRGLAVVSLRDGRGAVCVCVDGWIVRRATVHRDEWE